MDKDVIDRKFRLPPDQGGFGDIVADPEMYDLMMRRVDRATLPPDKGGDGKNGLEWETYSEIGTEIRSKYLSDGATPGVTSFQTKVAEKGAVDVIPPQVSIAPNPEGSELTAPKENPNPKQTVAEMATARRIGA